MVCPASRRLREGICFVMLAGLFCCWPVGKREEGEKWLALPLEVTRAEWHQSFSLAEICKFELQWPKQFPHKIII